jgi:hypothetical protein
MSTLHTREGTPQKRVEKMGKLVEHNNHRMSSKCQDTGFIKTIVNKDHDSEDQAV